MTNLLHSIRRSINTTAPWTCPSCGTQRVIRDTCPICGGSRPVELTPPTDSALSEPFLLDPAHVGFVNGQSTRLQTLPMNSCLMLFMIPFALVGLFLLGWTVHEWYITAQIALYGTSAQAEVTGLWTEEDSEGGDSYHVSYRYTVQEREYTSKQQVDHESYQQLGQGARIDVLFDRTNPQISRIPGQRHDLMLNVCMPGVTVGWNVAVWVILIGMITTVRRDARLAREGQFIQGRILDCQGHSDGDGNYVVALQYMFPTPQGNQITGKDHCTREDLKPGKKNKRGVLPAPGTPVTVIYADDNCYRVL